jgi:LacI family transcriptional regulator
VANPFFTDVARGVEDEASEAGLAVILCNSDDQKAKESRYLEVLEEHRVQGILITPVSGADKRLASVQRRGTPVVLVDSRSPSRGQCSVSVDDVLGGDLAVSHLLEGGHEQIAFVGGPMSVRQVSDRRDGAVRALERAGRHGADLLVIETPALNVTAGQRAGAALAALPAGSRPSAVFCANDLLALGVLQEMTTRRIAVPGGVAIVGYDDVEFAAAAAVPLSSVRQPRHQLGRAAAQLLIEEALGDGTHRHRQVVFEPDLVVRASSQSRPRRARRPRRPPAEAGEEPHVTVSCCAKGSFVRKRPKASSCPDCGTGTASGLPSPPSAPEDETAVALPPARDGAAIGPLVVVVGAGAADEVSLMFGGFSIFIVRGTWNASTPSRSTPPTAA